jgi:hypothetical protein
MIAIDYFKKYPYALVILFVVIIWAVISTLQADKYTRELQKEGLYTLATIIDVKGASSGRWVEVKFFYNDREYKSKVRNDNISNDRIGEKIVIKFFPSKPVVIELYESIEVSDSLKKISSPIWKDLP